MHGRRTIAQEDHRYVVRALVVAPTGSSTSGPVVAHLDGYDLDDLGVDAGRRQWLRRR